MHLHTTMPLPSTQNTIKTLQPGLHPLRRGKKATHQITKMSIRTGLILSQDLCVCRYMAWQLLRMTPGLKTCVNRANSDRRKSCQSSHKCYHYHEYVEVTALHIQHEITRCVFIVKETVGILQDFSTSFSAYSSFLQKILPYQLTRFVHLYWVLFVHLSVNRTVVVRIQEDSSVFTACSDELFSFFIWEQNVISVFALEKIFTTF